MEEILNNLSDFFTQSPEYIYLIVGVIFLIFLIGAIKDKKWAIDPANGNQRLFYKKIGHKSFRLIMSIVYLIGSISCFIMFLFYFFDKF